MQSSRVLVLIRDAKTGNILTKPDEGQENQNWLARSKSGLGRASKNDWDVTSVRTDFELFLIPCAHEYTRESSVYRWPGVAERFNLSLLFPL